MKTQPNLFQRTSKSAFLPSLATIVIGALTPTIQAATWLPNGPSTDWNTPANWDPSGVPNGVTASINTKTGNIATISADPTNNPADVIPGDGSGMDGLLQHTAGTYTTGSWVKIGHNSGTGVYNVANTAGTGGTLTGFAQGSGGFTISGGGNLRVGGGDAGSGGAGTLNINTTGIISVGGNLYVGTNTSTGTIKMDSGTIRANSEVIIGNGEFGGSGVTGTLNMSGGTFTKQTNTDVHFIVGSAGATGNVNMTGGILNNNRELWIGVGSGSTGQVTLSGSATFNTVSWVSIGRSGGTGTMTVNGGTLNSTNADFSNFIVGDNSPGTLNQTAGAINVGRETWVGNGATANYNMSGGTATSGSWFVVGRGSGTGILTMSGGTIDKTAAGSDFVVGADASSTGTVHLSDGLINATGVAASIGKDGSGVLNLSSTGEFQTNTMFVGQNSGSNGTLNLNGGTLTVNALNGGSGTSTAYFNGSTLKARQDNATFLQGLIHSTVLDGGVIVDTNGFNVSIAQGFGQDGIGVIRKIGTGTLTFSGSDDNAAIRARVDAGTLVLGKNSDGGVHSVGTSGGDVALLITGGTAALGGSGGDQLYSESAVNITGGTFDLAGQNEGFDGLSGDLGAVITNSVAITSTLTLGEKNSIDSPIFAGVIQDGTGTVALTKTTYSGSTGTQVLTATNTYTGATTISAGRLQLGNGGATGSLSPNSAIAISTNGTLVIKHNNDVTQGTDFSTAPITGDGGLTQSGSGTTFLTAANSYTGTTAVTNGTLGGNGSVAGLLTVTSFGTLNPGVNGIGTFSAGDDTTFTSGGGYICDVSGATSDKLMVTGDLKCGSGFLSVNEITPPSGTLIIAEYTGEVVEEFDNVLLPDGYEIDYNYLNQKKVAIKQTSSSPFETWATDNITSIDPEADATPTGDPDNDGETNLAEFALNGDPLSGAASGKVVSRVANVGGVASLVLTIPVRGTSASDPAFSGLTEKVSATTDGIDYRVQGSLNLVSWNTLVTEVTSGDKTTIETGLPGLDSGWFYRTFTTGPVSGAPKSFMRAAFKQP